MALAKVDPLLVRKFRYISLVSSLFTYFYSRTFQKSYLVLDYEKHIYILYLTKYRIIEQLIQTNVHELKKKLSLSLYIFEYSFQLGIKLKINAKNEIF